MDRALDHQEQVKVRTARANFFQVLKRKDSTAQTTQPEKKTTTSTDQPYSTSSNKRFKLPDMSPSKPSGSGSNVPLIVRFYDPDIPPAQAKDARDRSLEEILSWSDSQLEHCHNYIQMLFPLPEGSPFNWDAPVIDREVMLAFRSRSELRDSLRRSFERMLDFYGFTASNKPEGEGKKEVDEAKGSAAAEGANEAKAQQETGSEQSTQAVNAADQTAEGNDQSTTPSSATSETKTPTTDTDAAVVADIAGTDTPASTTDVSGYYVIRAPHWRKSFRNWAVRSDHNHLRITRILRCLRVLGLQTECDAFFTALKRVFDDPAIHINERSMMYWQRAVNRPLYIAPDDDRCGWLKKWEDQQEAGGGK